MSVDWLAKRCKEDATPFAPVKVCTAQKRAAASDLQDAHVIHLYRATEVVNKQC